MPFVQKKIAGKGGIAELIINERTKAKLTPEELANQTGISLKYLNALEKRNYHLLPGGIYTNQFLKKLADFFHLNEKILLTMWQKEKISYQDNISTNQKTEKMMSSWLTPMFIRKSAIAIILLGLFSYLSWELKNIFTPPDLVITFPLSQTITQESSIEIRGETEPESHILINQQPILLSTDGSFKQMVDLTVGLNIFTIASSKAHSKPSLQTISILRQLTQN